MIKGHLKTNLHKMKLLYTWHIFIFINNFAIRYLIFELKKKWLSISTNSLHTEHPFFNKEFYFLAFYYAVAKLDKALKKIRILYAYVCVISQMQYLQKSFTIHLRSIFVSNRTNTIASFSVFDISFQRKVASVTLSNFFTDLYNPAKFFTACNMPSNILLLCFQ